MSTQIYDMLREMKERAKKIKEASTDAPAKTHSEPATETAKVSFNVTTHADMSANEIEAEMIIQRILDGETVKVSNRDNYDILVRLVRLRIADLRKDGVPIITTTAGYRKAGPDDKDEVVHTVASLRHRAYEILAAAEGIAEGYGLPGMTP